MDNDVAGTVAEVASKIAKMAGRACIRCGSLQQHTYTGLCTRCLGRPLCPKCGCFLDRHREEDGRSHYNCGLGCRLSVLQIVARQHETWQAERVAYELSGQAFPR